MHEKYERSIMKTVFLSYNFEDEIPVAQYLKNKKLKKYFNRETEAAIVGMGKLTEGIDVHSETPFYYALGSIEYEDYGLKEIVFGSRTQNNLFSNKLFIEKGLPSVSPLNQFKVLQNMPLSFIAIEYNLLGDNAVIYTSACGLLIQALHSVVTMPILIAASKAYADGKIEVGFALIEKNEIEQSSFLNFNGEAVEIFRAWSSGRNIS